MKILNKFSFVVLLLTACLFTPACKKVNNFLEKAPGVDIDESAIFTSKAQLELFMTAIYRFGIHPIVPYKESTLSPAGFPTVSSTYCYSENFTENGESQATFSNSIPWNNGTIQANSIINSEDVRYYIRWVAIRYINIVLTRINDVPDPDPQNPNEFVKYKNQVIGEVKALRALNYFEMLKRYGGMPIVTKKFENDEEINLPRNTVEECVKFILTDCEDALTKLPDSYPSNMVGRVSRGAVLALKSKVLLFAASPLFNTATPYLSSANNKLVCYGNADNERWKLAMDAADAALTWAANNGYKLITDKGTDKNYKFAWETPNNTEIILAEQIRSATNSGNYPWAANYPVPMGGSWDAVEVTHNFVKKYDKKDGTPQVWDAAGGNDLTAKYNELDLRFKQTVAYNGSFFTSNNAVVETFEGGKHAANCLTGAWMKKFVPDALNVNVNVQPTFALFRVNELYLNLAEAVNEYSGPIATAYNAVNTVRARSGMPPLTPGLTKEEFRAKIHKERDIELCFEDHHFWDLRRWLEADQVGTMKGPIEGIKITKVGTLFKWVPYVFETRIFDKKLTLHPLPFNEVQKGNLIQNPGW